VDVVTIDIDCHMKISKRPFDVKILCLDICPWTLSVLSIEQFSESVAQGKDVSFEEQ